MKHLQLHDGQLLFQLQWYTAFRLLYTATDNALTSLGLDFQNIL